MGQASSSAATGIGSPGGSIIENSPGIWVAAIVAVIVIFWLWKRK